MRRPLAFAALALGGIVVGLCLLELGLRMPAWLSPYGADDFRRWAAPHVLDYTAHPFLPFALNPGRTVEIHWTDPHGGADHVVFAAINRHGFRAHEFSARENPDDLVVVCLGGSTTWGAVAPTNADTWPEKLEALLQTAHPDRRVRVYNLGISAANSGMSLVNLATHGVHLRPDLVITYHLVNDSEANAAADFRTDYRHFYRDFSPDTAWVGYHQALPAWLRRSYLAVTVARGLDDVAGTNALGRNIQREIEAEPDIDSVVVTDRLLANLRSIAALARGHGAQALFATFQWFDPSDGGAERNDHLRHGFARYGLDYVDVDAAIPDGDRSLQVDACHFTEPGRTMVAEAFFRHIVDHGLLDDESRPRRYSQPRSR